MIQVTRDQWLRDFDAFPPEVRAAIHEIALSYRRGRPRLSERALPALDDSAGPLLRTMGDCSEMVFGLDMPMPAAQKKQLADAEKGIAPTQTEELLRLRTRGRLKVK